MLIKQIHRIKLLKTKDKEQNLENSPETSEAACCLHGHKSGSPCLPLADGSNTFVTSLSGDNAGPDRFSEWQFNSSSFFLSSILHFQRQF